MKQLFFIVFLAFAATCKVFPSEVVFTATAPATVGVGESFRLSYSLNENGKDIRIPELADFEVKYGPEVSRGKSVQIINTKVETHINETYTYILKATKEGSFEIAPASITVSNKVYKSNAITIKVVPSDQANQNNSSHNAMPPGEEPSASIQISPEDVFLRASVSKNSVYENEGLLISYKLYFRINLENYSIPSPNFDNIITQEIDGQGNVQLKTENYNGKTYRTFVMREFIIFPQKSGKITIPKEKIDITASILARRARSFFENDQYLSVKKTIYSNPVSIDVKPLPSANRPASFTGAVGSYSLKSNISSEQVKSNEPITISIEISGKGNLKMIKNPELVFPADFEIYDPKVDLATQNTQSGVSGKKTIDYLVIPRYAGDFTISPYEFSYFDLSSSTYKTLKTPKYELKIEKSKDEALNPSLVNYTNKEDLRYLGKDILFIKTNTSRFSPTGAFLFGSLSYWLSFLIPLALFLLLFSYYRKLIKENANLTLLRTKKANKVAAKRLKNAKSLLLKRENERFYEEILVALWGYLSDKLSIPPSLLNKDNIETELQKFGVEEDSIKQLIELLNKCEFARYAPVQEDNTMDQIYELAANSINKIDNTLKR